jgi:hypothetical protein
MLFLDRALTRSVKTRRNRAIAVINPGKVTNEWRSRFRSFMPHRIMLPLLVGRMAYSWQPGFPSRVFFDTKPALCRRLGQAPEPWRVESGLKRHNLNRFGLNWHDVTRYGAEPHGLDIAPIAVAGGAEMSLVQFA